MKVRTINARFGDAVAVEPLNSGEVCIDAHNPGPHGDGFDAYLSPKAARKLAKALVKAAKKVEALT